MPELRAIPRAGQREERWSNGAGTTTVILREPDSADWTVRISVARVDHPGPFSELAGTRRVLVPLDAPMALRFADGREESAARLGCLEFEGVPAPAGLLPEGPTRDFNLMLRGATRGEVWPRTLVDAMLVPHGADDRWLVYLVTGQATLRAQGGARLPLEPGDAAMISGTTDTTNHVTAQGVGEIILVRLYA